MTPLITDYRSLNTGIPLRAGMGGALPPARHTPAAQARTTACTTHALTLPLVSGPAGDNWAPVRRRPFISRVAARGQGPSFSME